MRSNVSEQKDVGSNLDFWKTYLDGELSELNLPTDFPRQTISKPQSGVYSFTISGNINEDIKILSLQENVKIPYIFLTVLTIILSRYSGAEDIRVGVILSELEHSFKNLVTI